MFVSVNRTIVSCLVAGKMNIEILEFIRPDDGKNSLYITGISQDLDTKELYVSI